MGEMDYYPAVRKWLERNGFYCGGGMVYSGTDRERVYENIGTKAMRVDVAGVRNVGSLYADSLEVACVEVKEGRSVTFSQVAQAYGYSLIANRVYLAHTAELDDYWNQFLRRIGLGYLSINSKSRAVKELIPSSLFNPDQASYLEFIHALWIVQCSICGVYTFRWDQLKVLDGKSFIRLRRGAHVARMRAKDDSPYNSEIPPSRLIKRYICRHCLDDLFSEDGQDPLAKKGRRWASEG